MVSVPPGESGDCLYMIESGEFDVLKRNAEGVDTKVFRYVNSGAFGELALMYNCPRAATVQAVGGGCLWALDRAAFRHLLVGYNQQKRALYEEFLEHVPLLGMNLFGFLFLSNLISRFFFFFSTV